MSEATTQFERGRRRRRDGRSGYESVRRSHGHRESRPELAPRCRCLAKEARRRVDEKNKYTLVFLYAPEDEALVEESKKKTGRDQPMVELTYNWNTEDYGEARYFGHLAYEVDDIYATCEIGRAHV